MQSLSLSKHNLKPAPRFRLSARAHWFAFLILVLSVGIGNLQAQLSAAPAPPKANKLEEDFDFKPPQRNVGERLFLDTRFSQLFFAASGGDANAHLKSGDPALAKVHTATSEVPGPFASGSINCRSCHYVDELASDAGGSNRTYSDFETHSRIPSRFGHATTARNSIAFVNAFIGPKDSMLLHADGEFNSVRDLVEETMTGKNFGWKPQEREQAITHIAHIIRDDDGSDPLAKLYGGSYKKVLLGVDTSLRAGVHLPKDFRMDVTKASDREIMDMVTRLMEAYLIDLQFSRSFDTFYDGSPYDVFLRVNSLPLGPDKDETPSAYAQRLAQAINAAPHLRFVPAGQFNFSLHKQPFQFGELELRGLKVFLARANPAAPAKIQAASSPAPPKMRPFSTLSLALSAAMVLGVFTIRRPKGRPVLLVIGALLLAWSVSPMQQAQAAQTADAAHTASHVGNCVACHTPPDFTDFRFHNNGAEQQEYDAVHGAGAFARLSIPSFAQRQRNAKLFLPATVRHPDYLETMRAQPAQNNPRLADLGMWNIFANADYPAPQAKIERFLCGDSPCDPAKELPQTVALFKTPTLRDLADSQPYMHTGRLENVEQVLVFYRQMSALARAGKVRNADPELAGIDIDADDATALAAFLRSLTEDYEAPLPSWKR